METSRETAPSMAVARATVIASEVLRGGCQRLELALPGDLPAPEPGQFAMLSTDDPRFPLLPRPFSLLGCRREGDDLRLEFMIMPVGRGSGLLCDQRPGDTCQVVGPLGGRIEQDLPEGPLVCVAGGYGVAPFLFLAERWRDERPERLAGTTVIFGARTAERLTLAERLAATGVQVQLCTDDGSEGFTGRVDAALSERLAADPPALVLTCGPDPMMEAVGAVCRAAGVPARASLETVMGCGYAVCNGCAVAVDCASEDDGLTYELACREGTVFDEARLQWHRL